MREGRTEIDSMLEALRLTVSGIIDEVQGIKTTQSGLLERIVAVEARLQNALVGVNKNFVSMSNDIEVQCNVINKLVGTMNQWEREQKVLRRDVDEGQRWSQQLENGTMVVLMERLEKLETRMAEKDEEIAVLRGQVCLYRMWLLDHLLIGSRSVPAVNLWSRFRGRLAPFKSPSVETLTQRCYRSTGSRTCTRARERR